MASVTLTNELGILGDMESSTTYVDSNEYDYFKISSKYKFGSNSRAFQYSGTGPVDLSYSLRNANGLQVNNWIGGHKYYFSIWIMQRTVLTPSIGVTFGSNGEPLPPVTNTTLNEWEHHSNIVSKVAGYNWSGTFVVKCYNHPGNNGLTNIDGLMWVDLTAAFGAGNEPDKAWCDANIPFTTSSVTVDYTPAPISKGPYIGVGGVAHKITKGYIGVNGVARKIKKAYVGVGGVAKCCFISSVNPNFADNTWADIISACQARNVPASWAVGDSKTMTINGTSYQIDIIGKGHDTYSDGSGTAPLTFQLHDLYVTKYAMNGSNTNKDGWTASTMRTTHLPAILTLMPLEVQAGIKEVDKKTSAGYGSNTINTTADKLFLLSEMEAHGNNSYSKSGEGTRYAYYTANPINGLVKKLSGTSTIWWLRSPYYNNTTGFCYTQANGGITYTNASASYGVAFAFCF